MHILDTKLDGVKLINQDRHFEDHRGIYRELFNEQLYKDILPDIKFLQDDISISYKNVLRGIHGDEGTWKLITCLKGRFYLVVVNNDSNTNQFGEWESFILSEENDTQVLVPPKFGNGHLVLSDEAIFHYKQSTLYGEYKQFTIRWDDSHLNIPWPCNNPILSQRDKNAFLIDFTNQINSKRD